MSLDSRCFSGMHVMDENGMENADDSVSSNVLFDVSIQSQQSKAPFDTESVVPGPEEMNNQPENPSLLTKSSTDTAANFDDKRGSEPIGDVSVHSHVSEARSDDTDTDIVTNALASPTPQDFGTRGLASPPSASVVWREPALPPSAVCREPARSRRYSAVRGPPSASNCVAGKASELKDFTARIPKATQDADVIGCPTPNKYVPRDVCPFSGGVVAKTSGPTDVNDCIPEATKDIGATKDTSISDCPAPDNFVPRDDCPLLDGVAGKNSGATYVNDCIFETSKHTGATKDTGISDCPAPDIPVPRDDCTLSHGSVTGDDFPLPDECAPTDDCHTPGSVHGSDYPAHVGSVIKNDCPISDISIRSTAFLHTCIYICWWCLGFILIFFIITPVSSDAYLLNSPKECTVFTRDKLGNCSNGRSFNCFPPYRTFHCQEDSDGLVQSAACCESWVVDAGYYGRLITDSVNETCSLDIHLCDDDHYEPLLRNSSNLTHARCEYKKSTCRGVGEEIACYGDITRDNKCQCKPGYKPWPSTCHLFSTHDPCSCHKIMVDGGTSSELQTHAKPPLSVNTVKPPLCSSITLPEPPPSPNFTVPTRTSNTHVNVLITLLSVWSLLVLF